MHPLLSRVWMWMDYRTWVEKPEEQQRPWMNIVFWEAPVTWGSFSFSLLLYSYPSALILDSLCPAVDLVSNLTKKVSQVAVRGGTSRYSLTLRRWKGAPRRSLVSRVSQQLLCCCSLHLILLSLSWSKEKAKSSDGHDDELVVHVLSPSFLSRFLPTQFVYVCSTWRREKERQVEWKGG